jgi:hypothetical protein
MLGRDDVHDHAALEHLGQALLGRPGRLLLLAHVRDYRTADEADRLSSRLRHPATRSSPKSGIAASTPPFTGLPRHEAAQITV